MYAISSSTPRCRVGWLPLPPCCNCVVGAAPGSSTGIKIHERGIPRRPGAPQRNRSTRISCLQFRGSWVPLPSVYGAHAPPKKTSILCIFQMSVKTNIKNNFDLTILGSLGNFYGFRRFVTFRKFGKFRNQPYKFWEKRFCAKKCVPSRIATSLLVIVIARYTY